MKLKNLTYNNDSNTSATYLKFGEKIGKKGNDYIWMFFGDLNYECNYDEKISNVDNLRNYIVSLGIPAESIREVSIFRSRSLWDDPKTPYRLRVVLLGDWVEKQIKRKLTIDVNTVLDFGIYVGKTIKDIPYEYIGWLSNVFELDLTSLAKDCIKQKRLDWIYLQQEIEYNREGGFYKQYNREEF